MLSTCGVNHAKGGLYEYIFGPLIAFCVPQQQY